MKQFFSSLKYRIAAFYQGRYGVDELNHVLLFSGIALSLLSRIDGMAFCVLLSYVCLFAVIFRMLSKNLAKRRIELERYLGIKHRITGFFSRKKRAFRERKTHRYFTCKQCKTAMRVPKGKGKIAITCPKCGTKVIKKT